MRYTQIRAFHFVAAHGGFNAAARALRVGQPAISYQVKALEQTFGVTLLNRGPRSTTLTKEGQRLFEITSRLFSIEDEAERLLRSMKDEKMTRLRIGSDAPYSVGRVAAAFGHQNPEVNVSLTMGTAEELEKQLQRDVIDVAILVRGTNNEELRRVPFATHRIVLLVGGQHPWAARDDACLSELHRQPMALRESTHSLTSLTFERALARAGITPVIAMQVNNREHLREAVAAGVGIGVGVASDAESDFRLHTIRIADTELSISDALVCKRTREDEPAIQAFMTLALKRSGLEPVNTPAASAAGASVK